MFSIRDYCCRASYLIKNEGFLTFIRKIITSYVYMKEKYYIRENYVGDLNEISFRPEINEFSFKLITDSKTADEWAKQTGCDFRNQILHSRQRLHAGAVAFCIFVGKELVSIIWLASNPEAKRLINPLPFKVDFDARQACTSGAETVPKYRGKRLMTYLWFKRNEYMKQQSISKLIATAPVADKTLLHMDTKIPSHIVAEGYYFHFLWFRYWKEIPVPEGFQPPGVGNDISPLPKNS